MPKRRHARSSKTRWSTRGSQSNQPTPAAAMKRSRGSRRMGSGPGGTGPEAGRWSAPDTAPSSPSRQPGKSATLATMSEHPRAGRPAQAADLVDVAALVTAYYTDRPDPSVAEQQVAFGTSGHRGSSLDRAFNEAHILATTQAICEHRRAAGIDGPLFLGRDP